MKNRFLVLIVFVGISVDAFSQVRAEGFTLVGKIIGKEIPKKIMGGWFYDFNDYHDTRFFTISVNDDGIFKVNIPDLIRPGRLSYLQDENGNILLGTMGGSLSAIPSLIEPGDSIYAIFRFDEEVYSVSYSGKGSAKFEAINKVNAKDNSSISQLKDVRQRIHIGDSLLRERLSLLKTYANNISEVSLLIVSNDIKGQVLMEIINRVIGSDSIADSETEMNIVNESSLWQSIDPDAVWDAASFNLTEVLFLKSIYDVQISEKKRICSFQHFYQYIRNSYRGSMREKLLVYLLLYKNIYGQIENIDPYAFSSCVKDALKVVKLSWYRKYIEQLKRSSVVGADVLDVALLSDSSSTRLSLRELKGNVALVDVWGYTCTSCYEFANGFHEKIYSEFKGNPHFKVVSIMLDDGAGKQHYLKRLRRENRPYYTWPEYINLYAGKDEPLRKKIEDHYQITGYPFVMLIGKNGKIIATYLPYYVGANPTHAEKVRELIRKALAD